MSFKSGSGQRRELLSFCEFIALRDAAESKNRLSRGVQGPLTMTSESAPSLYNPNNISNPLPVLITFQRKQILRFSDGKIVALYKEVRTGVEIVFPMLF